LLKGAQSERKSLATPWNGERTRPRVQWSAPSPTRLCLPEQLSLNETERYVCDVPQIFNLPYRGIAFRKGPTGSDGSNASELAGISPACASRRSRPARRRSEDARARVLPAARKVGRVRPGEPNMAVNVSIRLAGDGLALPIKDKSTRHPFTRVVKLKTSRRLCELNETRPVTSIRRFILCVLASVLWLAQTRAPLSSKDAKTRSLQSYIVKSADGNNVPTKTSETLNTDHLPLQDFLDYLASEKIALKNNRPR